MSERPLREVAAEMGIDHSALARIEQGQQISALNLAAILNWLMSTPVAGQPKQQELVEEEDAPKS
jgi:transcriptional regulator with XRE-family HTH domain